MGVLELMSATASAGKSDAAPGPEVFAPCLVRYDQVAKATRPITRIVMAAIARALSGARLGLRSEATAS